MLAALIVCPGQRNLWAADEPAEQVLKKHGLRIVGSMAVADTEAPIKSKLAEARRAAQRLRSLQLQQSATLSAEERQNAIESLSDQIDRLRNELGAVNQQLSQVPQMRGRLLNNYAQAQFADLEAYRASLQIEINEESIALNQLRSPSNDPRAKEKLDAEIRDKSDAHHQALVDLRKLVDETTQKYSELRQKEELTKALETLGKARTGKLKLGPSRDFLANAKLLERLEKAAATGATDEPATRSTRRSRRSAKGKRPSRTVPGATSKAPTGEPDNPP
jgi:hypothetical protein